MATKSKPSKKKDIILEISDTEDETDDEEETKPPIDTPILKGRKMLSQKNKNNKIKVYSNTENVIPIKHNFFCD